MRAYVSMVMATLFITIEKMILHCRNMSEGDIRINENLDIHAFAKLVLFS